MKTKTVKAAQLLTEKTPFIFKGRSGVYAVTRASSDRGNVRLFYKDEKKKEIMVASRKADDDVEIMTDGTDDTAKYDHLLDIIGALHTRNKSLQKGHATLTRRVQELEKQLEGCHEAISRLIGVAQNQVKRRMSTEEGKEHMRKYFQHQNCRCVEAPLSDRAVEAIIADVVKPEPTAADLKLQADINAISSAAKTLAKTYFDAVDRMLQAGGSLYRGVK